MPVAGSLSELNNLQIRNIKCDNLRTFVDSDQRYSYQISRSIRRY